MTWSAVGSLVSDILILNSTYLGFSISAIFSLYISKADALTMYTHHMARVFLDTSEKQIDCGTMPAKLESPTTPSIVKVLPLPETNDDELFDFGVAAWQFAKSRSFKR